MPQDYGRTGQQDQPLIAEDSAFLHSALNALLQNNNRAGNIRANYHSNYQVVLSLQKGFENFKKSGGGGWTRTNLRQDSSVSPLRKNQTAPLRNRNRIEKSCTPGS
jgi:hypothetical protein